MGVLCFLFQFAFHAGSYGGEEERDKVFIGSLAANFAKGIDIGCSVFYVDYDEGMTAMHHNPVR